MSSRKAARYKKNSTVWESGIVIYHADSFITPNPAWQWALRTARLAPQRQAESSL